MFAKVQIMLAKPQIMFARLQGSQTMFAKLQDHACKFASLHGLRRIMFSKARFGSGVGAKCHQ